jgi:hypothetical protein
MTWQPSWAAQVQDRHATRRPEAYDDDAHHGLVRVFFDEKKSCSGCNAM